MEDANWAILMLVLILFLLIDIFGILLVIYVYVIRGYRIFKRRHENRHHLANLLARSQPVETVRMFNAC